MISQQFLLFCHYNSAVINIFIVCLFVYVQEFLWSMNLKWLRLGVGRVFVCILVLLLGSPCASRLKTSGLTDTWAGTKYTSKRHISKWNLITGST